MGAKWSRHIQDDPTIPAVPVRLGVWRLRLAAAPRLLFERTDVPPEPEPATVGVADLVRYVATARLTLKGPLVVEIDGPGDPLVNPETVLRGLSLLREHHPDVMTGLVVHGPLLADYAEELHEFAVSYLVLRLDAASEATARRIVRGGTCRGEELTRDAAASLYVDGMQRALYTARRERLPLAARITLLPSFNLGEVEPLARLAAQGGAGRVDVVAPQRNERRGRGGTPTAGELAEAQELATRVFDLSGGRRDESGLLDWLDPVRLHDVDLDALDAVDILRTLPDPTEEMSAAGRMLPPRRAQIIAVASRDGLLVDVPLQAVPALRIYAVTDRSIRYLGTRSLEESIRRRRDGVGNAQRFLRAVVGCRALVATGFSPRALTLLAAVGIRPVTVGGAVHDVLDRVARGTIRFA